jgi:hypothetical protein
MELMAKQGVFNRHVGRGDKVVLLSSKHDIWLTRTATEVQALRDADAKAGRWHDDGGEPILYGAYASWPEGTHQVTVRVTSCRVQWRHWNRKPTGLRLGWCESLDREVIFRCV